MTKPVQQKQVNQKSSKLWISILLGVLIVGAIVAITVLIGNRENNKSLEMSLATPTDLLADALPATISVSDANTRFMEGAFLLDVREKSEWDQSHIEGAVLIPLGELSARIAEIPTNQDVLIICRSGNRSAQARDLLRAAGLDRTTSIDGGITQWISSGLPVVTGP
jgi:rhodanese-related sulfurtransferase